MTFGKPIGFLNQGRDVHYLITTQIAMLYYFRTVSTIRGAECLHSSFLDCLLSNVTDRTAPHVAVVWHQQPTPLLHQ